MKIIINYILIVMKKALICGAALVALTACSFHKELDPNSGQTGKNGLIGFTVANKNMSKASLQDAGHYNFGVFAYKQGEETNWVMEDYLVGFHDAAKAYRPSGSTVGDSDDPTDPNIPNGVVDGKSRWMYEGMGKNQYNGTYAGGAITRWYQSNKDEQYLKYWDLSTSYTCFYAYAPYVGTDNQGTRVTYVDGTPQTDTGNDTHVMNFPNGTIVAGMNNAEKHEYMYATAKVGKDNYGHDVSLTFKRLVAKVNIKFWEDVPGYKVRIIDLTSDYGVAATPSIKAADNPDITKTWDAYGYRKGLYYASNGAKIQFDHTTPSAEKIKQYNGNATDAPLNFGIPAAAQIGETRIEAKSSPDTYYAIPKNSSLVLNNSTTNTTPDFTETAAPTEADIAKTGFTFHVSYELTADDSGETIKVTDATVHVPAAYCEWEMNKHYTYIFKITKGSNGSTDTVDPDPNSPSVPTTPALYPIVFDNCTVVDWDDVTGEWNITDGTQLSYHSIELSSWSVNNSSEQTITVTIADDDKHSSHAIDYSKVAVTGPNGNGANPTGISYDSSAKTITVGTNAAAGVYTVTYTCPEGDINNNHPAKWTAQFVVGNAYAITTEHPYLACNGTEQSASMGITIKKDGSNFTRTGADKLYIEYPDNFDDTEQEKVTVSGNNVVVDKAATPGTYKLVYELNEGSIVKVAEATFEVRDYSFTLSHPIVYKEGSDVTVKASQIGVDAEREFTVRGNITPSGDKKNEFVVDNTNTAEGTYTVTYTVWSGGASQTTYTQKFEVRNTHSVSLSQNTIHRTANTSSSTATSSDEITVTTKTNGVAVQTDESDKLTVVTSDPTTGEPTATTESSITLTWNDTAKNYTLKVERGTPVGKYYVKYTKDVYNGTGTAAVSEYAEFNVVD